MLPNPHCMGWKANPGLISALASCPSSIFSTHLLDESETFTGSTPTSQDLNKRVLPPICNKALETVNTKFNASTDPELVPWMATLAAKVGG